MRCRKSLQKNSAPCHDERFGKNKYTKDIPNITQAIYSRPVDNITLSVVMEKAIPPEPGTRQSCLFTPYLLNVAHKVLARAIRVPKEIKGIQI